MAKGEQTRQRIVSRSAPVFNIYGYAGTTMSELTQATGLEKGGIYNHFPSKEALALASFDYAVEIISQLFIEALAGKEHASERLLAIVGVFERYLDAPPVEGGCPVLNTAIEADDTHPALRERARDAMTSWQKLIGKQVKQGVLSGEFQPNTDPREVASIVASTLEGAVMLSKLYDDPIHLKRAIAHISAYIRSLIAEDPFGRSHQTD